jgi:hypothetical protein
MIMASIVNAITRQKIQNATAVLGEELAVEATFVLDIHAQQIQ